MSAGHFDNSQFACVHRKRGQVGLFSGASVNVVESGDLVSQIVITVDGLANGSDEKLIVDGHVIELTHLNSETTASNSYDVDVTVAGASATVTIFKAAGFTESAAESLLNTLAYNNTSEAVVDGAASSLTLRLLTMAAVLTPPTTELRRS